MYREYNTFFAGGREDGLRTSGDFRERSGPSSAGKRGVPRLARNGFQARPGGDGTRRGSDMSSSTRAAEPLFQRAEPLISPRLRIPLLSMNRRMPLFIEFATRSPSPLMPVTT